MIASSVSLLVGYDTFSAENPLGYLASKTLGPPSGLVSWKGATPSQPRVSSEPLLSHPSLQCGRGEKGVRRGGGGEEGGREVGRGGGEEPPGAGGKVSP